MRTYAIIALVIAVSGFLYLANKKDSPSTSDNQRLEVAKAIDSTSVNETFSFPLKDSKGVEVSKVEYTVEDTELKNEILVKGKKASSVTGRTFLVVNIKIKNTYGKSIDVATRDYLRLSVNGNESEWLAPDIHNDPVTVQADSVKMTRLAFPINETDKDLKLRIGELSSEKKIIPLDLKYQ